MGGDKIQYLILAFWFRLGWEIIVPLMVVHKANSKANIGFVECT